MAIQRERPATKYAVYQSSQLPFEAGISSDFPIDCGCIWTYSFAGRCFRLKFTHGGCHLHGRAAYPAIRQKAA